MTVQTLFELNGIQHNSTLIFIADINGSELGLTRSMFRNPVLYPTELREQESQVVVLLCFKTCSFFVIIFRERTRIFIFICDQHGLP